MYTADSTLSAKAGAIYKLFFQSRDAMFQVEAAPVGRDVQLFAFQFVNMTPLDVAEIRGKLAQIEIMAAR